MSVIAAIEISRHRIALEPVFAAAWDPEPRRFFEATIVRIHDSEGRIGIGSGTDLDGFARYATALLGHDPRDLPRHHRILANIDFHGPRPWPVEAALWDLVASIQGRPLHEVLGGATDRVRLYSSMGTLGTADEVADAADRAIAAKFGAMKIRFGRPSLGADLEVLAHVAAHVAGRGLELMVDCNQGWRMPSDTTAPWAWETAVRVAEAAAAAGVLWIEEPLHRSDHVGMRALRDLGLVRVAGGEMTRDPAEFDRMLEVGSLDVYQPDAVLTVGLLGLVDLARHVVDSGGWFTPHTWGNGIGLAVNLALCAATGGGPFLEYPLDPPAWTPVRRDFMLTTALEPDEDGALVCSGRPGLGVELDQERLADTLVERQVLR